jgi:hypothetical protein
VARSLICRTLGNDGRWQCLMDRNGTHVGGINEMMVCMSSEWVDLGVKAVTLDLHA